jgi:guanylate kinase
MSRGLLVVLSAPSGGGKTTILKHLLDARMNDAHYSISATTRGKRSEEMDGKDYHFVDQSEFDRMVADGEFIEWAEVHGNYYGTPKKPIKEWLNKGKLVLLDIDVQGGLNVKKEFGDDALLVFIAPPSFDVLVERLAGRNSESTAQIKTRLTRYPMEMEQSAQYDVCVVNRTLTETVEQISKIIDNYRRSRLES